MIAFSRVCLCLDCSLKLACFSAPNCGVPQVIFMDIGTNSSICNSSLGYSMQSLKLPGFDVDFSCDEITNTSLTNLLARMWKPRLCSSSSPPLWLCLLHPSFRAVCESLA